VLPQPGVAERIDLDAFTHELDLLQARVRAELSEADVRHLRKIEGWGRVAALLGYATSWIAPNPLSVLGIAFARYVRWTAVAHPVCHRGYDRSEALEGRKGSTFARGRRRVLDWFDWIDPDAWHEEHNLQHHYRLNEEADPDLVERNLRWLRDSRLPRWLRLSLVPLFAISWKFVYYAPSTLEALERAEARRARAGERSPVELALAERWSERRVWSFLPRVTARLWLRSWAPYLLVFFVLIPALATPLGWWAVLSVLINSVLAEFLTNAHAFVTIVPNHAGADLYRFEGRTRSRGEFYLRQIVGSTNYRCGGDFNDVMHGWLNYQIEHHLWPDMTLLQYRRAQPEVRAICERHGVPYVQESVWRRCSKAVAIIVGDASMPVWRSR
jgi:fatty acid desaturase